MSSLKQGQIFNQSKKTINLKTQTEKLSNLNPHRDQPILKKCF